MTEQEVFEKAKKRVKAKKVFFVHFGIYLATVGFLFAINYLTFSDTHIWWAFFPALAWGVGIVAHYVIVFGIGIVSQLIASFGYDAPMDEHWEEKELEKEIAKIKRENSIKAVGNKTVNPEDELELKEIEKLRNKLDDKDFV